MGHSWTEHCSQSADSRTVGAGPASIFKGWSERKRKGEGGRERNNHWERNVLSTGAPTNCLAHEFTGCVRRRLDLDPALPPQGCWHLNSADDSSVWHGISFSFFLFFFPSFQTSQLTSPKGPPPPPLSPSEVAWLWWIGIFWVSNLLRGSLMRRPGTGRIRLLLQEQIQLKVSFHRS